VAPRTLAVGETFFGCRPEREWKFTPSVGAAKPALAAGLSRNRCEDHRLVQLREEQSLVFILTISKTVCPRDRIRAMGAGGESRENFNFKASNSPAPRPGNRDVRRAD